MRTMSYRRELYCEDRYTITNTPESYMGDVPAIPGQKSPSIRVSNVPQKNGEIEADMADQAELNWALEVDEITPEFRDNYIKILCGELPKWKLFNVELHPGGNPCLNFINEDTGVEEHLFIERVPGLRIMFETDQADGYTNKYLLEVRGTDDGGTSMVLTEYYHHGRYKIIFDGIPLCKSSSNDEIWEYVYVTEILY